MNRLPHLQEGGTTVVFGNVPNPGIDVRIIDKPQFAGWNDRGPRRIVGVCVHRMLGGLSGTEQFFKNPADSGWGALTDFGIGGLKDAGLDGAIWQWNGLTGARSPWANGWADNENPANVTEGHGREFWQRWSPPHDLNRDLASIELSGCTAGANWCGGDETPVTPAQLNALNHLIAYVCDHYCQISYEAFPFNPRVGPDFYAVYQHYEFAGKDCPFPTIKALHQTYVDGAREIMRQYQTQGTPSFEAFGTSREFHVRQNAHANGRQSPNRGAAVIRTFGPGAAIMCNGFFHGELVDGEDRWLQTSDQEHLTMHASAFVEGI